MENKFYVYMLKCSDNTYYIGHTDNFQKRLTEHNNGKFEGYTSVRGPLIPVFLQDFTTREEAKIAESKIKRWSSKKKEALINKDWRTLSVLGKKKFDNSTPPSAPLDTFRYAKHSRQSERETTKSLQNTSLPFASSDCEAIVSRGADDKTKF